jgi:hypothetical protein
VIAFWALGFGFAMPGVGKGQVASVFTSVLLLALAATGFALGFALTTIINLPS